MGLFRNRNSWNKPNILFVLELLSFQNGCKTFIVTLLVSDMSVINSGPNRKNYSDHSSYSYSGIVPQKHPVTCICLDNSSASFPFPLYSNVESDTSVVISRSFLESTAENSDSEALSQALVSVTATQWLLSVTVSFLFPAHPFRKPAQHLNLHFCRFYKSGISRA